MKKFLLSLAVLASATLAYAQTGTYEAPLTDAQGAWTFENVTLPEGATTVWTQDAQYGFIASGFIGGANKVADAYAVSPVLQLGENSVLTFEHTNKFNDGKYSECETLWIREEGAKTWAAQLTIPTYATGADWKFVSSGDISLAAYKGKKVQLGWRYTSTTEKAAKWEFKNVKVTNAQTTVAGPVVQDPTNTQETAYTVAQMISIIDGNYDLSKQVFGKGIISKVESFSSKHGSITYWISEDGKTESQQFEVYGGLGLNGEKFTAKTDLKEGDVVVVKGTIKKYKDVYEFNSNNVLVSLNANAASDAVATPAASEAAATYLVAEDLKVTLTCATEGAKIMYTVDGEDADENEYTGPVSIPAGTHTLKVVALKDGKYSKEIALEYNVSKLTATELANVDLEEWADNVPTGWTTVTSVSTKNYTQSSDALHGASAVLVKGLASNQRLASQEMTLAPGWYTLKAYAKDASEGQAKPAKARLGYATLDLQPAGYYKVNPTYNYAEVQDLKTTEWTELTYTFEIKAPQAVSLVAMNNCKNSEKLVLSVLFDNFEFRAATPEEITLTTGVSTLKAATADEVIYDLSGRRVSKAVKGLYIQNGRKYVK